MKNTLLQGFLIIILFFAILFAAQEIDWMTLLKVEETSNKTEEKLGEFYWELFKNTETENTDTFILECVDSILNKVCIANDLDKEFIKIHVLDKDDINAFALPNGHLIVFSGLIADATCAEELSGVLCHEIAHIELNHVMKKLIKEVGLTALISITTGNNGGEIIKESAKMLSSSAFDRSLEKEADITAVDYLTNAKIDPEPLANFLYKLSDIEPDQMQYFSWISTHPDSKERAEYVIKHSLKKDVIFEPVITHESWVELQERLTK